jgi:hypothetical protein
MGCQAGRARNSEEVIGVHLTMTVRDFVMLSLGEIVLVLTFGIGILVGCSLKRRESDNGNRDEEENRNSTGVR